MSEQITSVRTGLLASLLANNSTLRPSSSLYSKTSMANDLGRSRSYSNSNLHKSTIGKQFDKADSNHKYLPLCRAIHMLGVKIKKLNYYMFCKLEQYIKAKNQAQQLVQFQSGQNSFNSSSNLYASHFIQFFPSPINQHVERGFITPINHKSSLKDVSVNQIQDTSSQGSKQFESIHENFIQEPKASNIKTQKLKKYAQGFQLLIQSYQLVFLKRCSNKFLFKGFSALKKTYKLKSSLTMIANILDTAALRFKREVMGNISNAERQSLKIELLVDMLQSKIMAIYGNTFNILKFIVPTKQESLTQKYVQKQQKQAEACYTYEIKESWQKKIHLSSIQQQIQATDTLSDIPVKDQSTSQDLIFESYPKSKQVFSKYQTQDQHQYQQKIHLRKKNQDKTYQKKKKNIQQQKNDSAKEMMIKTKVHTSKIIDDINYRAIKLSKIPQQPLATYFHNNKGESYEMMIKLKHLIGQNLDSYKHVRDLDDFSYLWYKSMDQSLLQLSSIPIEKPIGKNAIYLGESKVLPQYDKSNSCNDNSIKNSCVFQAQISFSDNMYADSHNSSTAQDGPFQKFVTNNQHQNAKSRDQYGNNVIKSSQYFQSFNDSISLSKLQSFRFAKSKCIENQYSPIGTNKFCQSEIVEPSQIKSNGQTLQFKIQKLYQEQKGSMKNSTIITSKDKVIKSNTSSANKNTPNKFYSKPSINQKQKLIAPQQNWKKLHKRYDTLNSQISKIPSMSSFQKLSEMMEDLEKIRARGEKINQLQSIFGNQQLSNCSSTVTNSVKKSKNITTSSIEREGQGQQTLKKDQKNVRQSISNKSRSIKKSDYSSKQPYNGFVSSNSQTINQSRNYIQWSTPNDNSKKKPKKLFSNEKDIDERYPCSNLSNSVSISATCKRTTNMQKNSFQKQNKKQASRSQYNKNQQQNTINYQQFQKNKTLTTARKMQQQIDCIINNRNKMLKTNSTYNQFAKTRYSCINQSKCNFA